MPLYGTTFQWHIAVSIVWLLLLPHFDLLSTVEQRRLLTDHQDSEHRGELEWRVGWFGFEELETSFL
jgi:hypothetical protein